MQNSEVGGAQTTRHHPENVLPTTEQLEIDMALVGRVDRDGDGFSRKIILTRKIKIEA